MSAYSAGALLEAATARLAAAGLSEPRREARLLVALAAGLEPGAVLGHPERQLDSPAAARLKELIERRATGEPYSRLRGSRPFWTLELALSPDTLDPRPDSETLVEAALAAVADRGAPLRLFDLGTSSGCLLLALLSELPRAFGVGVDILPGAVVTARRNAAAHHRADRAVFLVGNWGDALADETADVIVANPPYIASGEIDRLAPEVARHEPRLALDGGADGLRAYRELAAGVPRLLRRGGLALFELGLGQAPAVTQLMATVGLRVMALRRDLSGVERVVLMTRE